MQPPDTNTGLLLASLLAQAIREYMASNRLNREREERESVARALKLRQDELQIIAEYVAAKLEENTELTKKVDVGAQKAYNEANNSNDKIAIVLQKLAEVQMQVNDLKSRK